MGATTYYRTENQTVQWDKKKSQAGKIAQNVKTAATKPGDLGSVSGISSSAWEEKMDSRVVL